MKQHKWLPMILSFMLITLLLDACTFSVQVLPTLPSSPPTPSASPAATSTSVPPTVIPPSATPTAIPIRADSISRLEIFKSFKLNDIVRGLAFTPDGKVLAAAQGNDKDFTIHLWDIPSEQAIGTLDGHTGIVWDVAFSPNGEMLASVSSDKTAKVWDWRNKTLLKSLDFSGEVGSVSFSPDGQTLAVGGVDNAQAQSAAIWTYSVGSWEPRLKFSEYWNITAMAYSPKGDILVGGGTSRNVKVWRTSDGTSIFTLNHAHQVFKDAISPDGSTVATATCETVVYPACTNGSVWLWDLHTGKLIQKLTGFPDFVEDLAFTADGSSLIAASRDGTLHFYGTSNYQPLFVSAPPGGVSTLALSLDGGLLATGNDDGDVYLWKIVYRP